jgi:hypothetical protein
VPVARQRIASMLRHGRAVRRWVRRVVRYSPPGLLVGDVMLRRRTRGPVLFSEKIRYRMAHDRRPVLIELVDKYAVRDRIRRTVGDRYLTELLAVAEQPQQIDWCALPRNYAAKVTHGSRGNILVWDGAKEDARIGTLSERSPWRNVIVRPEHATPELMAGRLSSWLRLSYSATEWAYRHVPRRIIVEELLSDGGRIPDDVKIHVVDGEVEVIVIERMNETTGKREAIALNPDWTRRSLGGGFVEPPRPRVFEECCDVARRLSAGLDYLRVDLYVLGDRIVVGELTPYQGGGRPASDPTHHFEQVAASWDPEAVVRRSRGARRRLLGSRPSPTGGT